MAYFSISIHQWFRQSSRSLPWRKTNNSYKIWLSEIILQQTRVDQGLNYYLKFVENFPTVFDLAEASEDQVLNLWQGLGYYSRARNLHFTAKLIVDQYDGVFPTAYKDVLSLKGVGVYTAAAICSFASNLPYAVVDGNVYRVLARYFAVDTPIDSTIGKKVFQDLADELLDREQPGNHNQALMELGALVCTPKSPDCENCPVALMCQSRKEGTQLSFPIKTKKIKVRKRYLHFFVFCVKDKVVLLKRDENDIWKGLYQFPLIETDSEILSGDEVQNRFGDITAITDITLKHQLTHQTLFATFHRVFVDEYQTLKGEILVKNIDLIDYGMPQLLIRYMEDRDIFTL
ncbi:A/G-specific adenine glycosylase [Crocinitomix catalasitica]|uniref:A/G-specific adenine glycosylase n=1 Tax=Crocinitomix catalasitica TaxID=184607 RepID=UPI0004868B1C|nr:A/G-specific adenine glycosylase [Crocinitomix catalasitica]